MENAPHILVVDDNQEIRELLTRFMTKHGLRISTTPDGNGMREILERETIDLIVLDLMLPEEDGLTLCRQIREKSTIPIVMLTALGDDSDRIVGLEMGADDYVPKPFNARELLARIKAVLRRVQGVPAADETRKENVIRFGKWTFDLSKRELAPEGGAAVLLSTGEFNLLHAFVRHSGQVLSRDQLLDITQGRTAAPFDRSIDTQVSRLRRKLEDNPREPKIIKTVWGGGYVFTPSVTKA